MRFNCTQNFVYPVDCVYIYLHLYLWHQESVLNLRYPQEKPALFELWDCYLRDVLKLQQYIPVHHDDFLFHSLLLCLLSILKKKNKIGGSLQVILKTSLNIFIKNTRQFSYPGEEESFIFFKTFSMRATGFQVSEKLFYLKFCKEKLYSRSNQMGKIVFIARQVPQCLGLNENLWQDLEDFVSRQQRVERGKMLLSHNLQTLGIASKGVNCQQGLGLRNTINTS